MLITAIYQTPHGQRFLEALATHRAEHPGRVQKVFISYAWEPLADGRRAEQHAMLTALADDLRALGFLVFFDVDSMVGQLDLTMREQLTESDVILPICTPRFAARVNETDTNVAFEYRLILDKGAQHPHSVIPLHLSGDFNDAVPDALRRFIVLDMAEGETYADTLTTIRPLGLLPTLLDINPATPATGYAAYRAHYTPFQQAHLSDTLPPLPRHLVTRQGVLERIQTALTLHQHGALIPTTLHGTAGIGKTLTAAQFIHQADYPVRLWLPADTEATLTLAYSRAAHTLGVTTGPTLADWLPTLYTALRDTRCLFVFDNAHQPAQLAPYLPPANPNHHTLITSRSDQWPQPIPLDIFTPVEADAYLSSQLPHTTPEDRATLASALGYFPLALRQVAHYLSHQHLTIPDYLDTFHATGLGALAIDTPTPLDMPASALAHPILTQTWRVSREALAGIPHALPLLHLCAYLSPDALEANVLRPFPLHDGQPLSPMALTQTLTALRELGFLQRTATGHKIHRLWQHLIRAEQSPDLAASVAQLNRIVDHLSTHLGNYDDWQANPTARLAWLAHGDSVLDSLPPGLTSSQGELRVNIETIVTFLNQLGLCHRAKGDAQGAKAALERALAIEEAFYPDPQHIALAATLGNLGNALDTLGDAQGAKAAHERALSIAEHHHRDDFIRPIKNLIRQAQYSQGLQPGRSPFFNTARDRSSLPRDEQSSPERLSGCRFM